MTNQFSRTRDKVQSALNLQPRRALVGTWDGVVDDPYWLDSGQIQLRYLASNGAYSLPTLVRGPYQDPSIPLLPDHAVIVKNDTDGQPYIAATDYATVIAGGGRPVPAQPPPDGAFVRQDQIVTLRCAETVPPSMSIVISGWKPIVGHVAYDFEGDPGFDLTSFVPGSGHCVVGVFMKNDYVTPETFAGTAVPLNDDLTIADVNACIALAPITDTPVWFYDVHAGATTIQDSDTLFDARDIVSVPSEVTGTVTGPGASTDRALATWDSTSGTVLRNNPATNVDGSGNLTVNAYKVPSASTLTISSSAVTVTKAYHKIEASSGTTDNLNTINGLGTGQFVLIQADADDTITVKTTGGNISLNGGADFALSGDKALLLFNDGSKIVDVGAGGAGGVTSVTASSPLASSGGATPDISLSGTVAVNHGGTGQTTLPAHDALIGNGTGGVNSLAPSTARNVAISDGTDWISRALVAADIPTLASKDLFIATATATVGNAATGSLAGSGVGSLTLGANTLVVGQTYRLIAWGVYSTKAVLPGTLEIELQLAGADAVTTGAQTLIANLSGLFWRAWLDITVRSIGVSGTVIIQGGFDHLESAGTLNEVTWPLTNGTSTVTVDTTAAIAVGLVADWGTTDSANTISCTNFALQKLDTTAGGTGTVYPNRAEMWFDEFIVTGGTPGLIIDATQAHAAIWYNGGGSNGDTATCSFMLRGGTTYILSVMGRSQNNLGITDWTIDGVAIGSQDWYSASTTVNVIKTISSITVTGDGYHVLKATMNGKNGSSSGYFFLFSKIWLRDTAD